MDNVVYKLDIDCKDFLDELLDEFKKYISVMNYYRDTRWLDEPICRMMTPYPRASEHVASISNPQFYTPEKKGRTEETEDFIAYTIRNVWGKPNSMIFMKEQYKLPTAPIVEKLISRIRDNVGNHYLTKMQMALSWKSPGFQLKQHKDKWHDPWQKSALRYHCILKSNLDNYMYSGDDPDNMTQYNPQTGEIWVLNANRFHKACNLSETEDSLHFIIDFLA